MAAPDKKHVSLVGNICYVWLTGLSQTKEIHQPSSLKPLHHAEIMGKVSLGSHTDCSALFLYRCPTKRFQ